MKGDQECQSGDLADCLGLDEYPPECCSSGQCDGAEASDQDGSGADTADECQAACGQVEDCRFYTFDFEAGECFLTKTCQVVPDPLNEYVYGMQYCAGKKICYIS